MRRVLMALALPALWCGSAFADDPKPPTPPPTQPAPAPAIPPEQKQPEKPAELIPWLHDYEAAQTKAKAEKRGLFVYMTPSWFH